MASELDCPRSGASLTRASTPRGSRGRASYHRFYDRFVAERQQQLLAAHTLRQAGSEQNRLHHRLSFASQSLSLRAAAPGARRAVYFDRNLYSSDKETTSRVFERRFDFTARRVFCGVLFIYEKPPPFPLAAEAAAVCVCFTSRLIISLFDAASELFHRLGEVVE